MDLEVMTEGCRVSFWGNGNVLNLPWWRLHSSVSIIKGIE